MRLELFQAALRKVTIPAVVIASVMACGGRAQSTVAPSITGGYRGTAAVGGASGSGSSAGGFAGAAAAHGSAGSAGQPSLVRPRFPEMPPVMVDNPTGTRLVELFIGFEVYALFENGAVYRIGYGATANNEVTQVAPERDDGLTGVVQIDHGSVLRYGGTVSWWSWSGTGAAVTQAIPGVDRAVFLAEGCALNADGTTSCWSASAGTPLVYDPPKVPPAIVDIPASVELETNFNARCTLARDRQGDVTLFRPGITGGKVVATQVRNLPLDGPAVRLFEGCALTASGGARCVWATGLDAWYVDASCADAHTYDVVTSNQERLLYASLGGDLGGSALGISGTVYATVTPPDPKVSSIAMDPLPGIDKSTFVRSGYYMSCAVEPPSIKCWPHEGKNRNVPTAIDWTGAK